jgi:hypothetical protein
MMWPGLTTYVHLHCKKCKLCQMHMKNRKPDGKLPTKMAETTPWEIVCVDLVGPWSIQTPSGVKKLTAFTYRSSNWKV